MVTNGPYLVVCIFLSQEILAELKMLFGHLKASHESWA